MNSPAYLRHLNPGQRAAAEYGIPDIADTYIPGPLLAFTVLDRANSADRLNLGRNDLGLAKKEARFPREETCLASIRRR